MTLISLWLTPLQNSKQNIGSGAPNERGVEKVRNFQNFQKKIIISSACLFACLYSVTLRIVALRVGLQDQMLNAIQLRTYYRVYQTRKPCYRKENRAMLHAVNFDMYLILQRCRTCCFTATARLSWWSLSADYQKLTSTGKNHSDRVFNASDRYSQILHEYNGAEQGSLSTYMSTALHGPWP